MNCDYLKNFKNYILIRNFLFKILFNFNENNFNY